MDNERDMIEGRPFVVDEKPYCIWDPNLDELNFEFISSIDTGYFAFLADTYISAGTTDDLKRQAALALRASYCHGLETLFAFLFAALQAPTCVVGWLHKYQLEDLRKLVKKVQSGTTIRMRLASKPRTWEEIAATIFSFALFDNNHEKKAAIVGGYARLWNRFSKDFLDEADRDEYNSIKHGLRVRSGGFRVAIGRETTPGEPAPVDKMRSLGGSNFGSSFFSLEAMHSNRLNYVVRPHLRNWSPNNLAYGLQMIAFSVSNIVAFLKLRNAVEPSQVEFSWPDDPAHFDGPWRETTTARSLTWAPLVGIGKDQLPGKEQILATYEADHDTGTD